MGQQTFSDVVFVFPEEQQKRIHGHKVIIYLRCPYFAEMYFNSESNEDAPQEVSIKDLKPSVFQAFLTYLYTDRLDFDDVSFTEMEVLGAFANKFGVARLANICLRQSVKLMDSTFIADMQKGVNLKKYSDFSFVLCEGTEDGGSMMLDMEGMETEFETRNEKGKGKEKEKKKKQEKEKEKEAEKGGMRVYASRAILCTRCEYFAALLMGAGKGTSPPLHHTSHPPHSHHQQIGMKEGQDGVLGINDIDKESFEALLRFIYSDQMEEETSPDTAIALLSVANMYRLERLASLSLSLSLSLDRKSVV